MSVELAVIELIVAGTAQVDATNEKIQTDLTSLERAGKSAESGAASAERAARQAEAAARQIQHEITKTIHTLHSVLALAERAAVALGVDPNSKTTGQVIDVAKDALGGAAQGAKLGGVVGSVVPGVGNAVGAGVGAALGGALGIVEGLVKIDKKLEKLTESQGHGKNEIEDALVREQALARLDHAAGGGGRQVQ